MNKQFEYYEKLVESSSDESLPLKSATQTLWDLIVITAISAEQKRCYEKQIESRLARRKIPARFKYMVLNDPDNVKIGSGGSTLNVAKQLFLTYNHTLFTMKILLIHAGGYSQRMPTCTVLGKIFSPVPCRNPYINDILDLKLAIYTPFAVHMQPGIFLTSSDDFQTFDFDEQIEASRLFGLAQNDFVLIAHKSSLNIAKDHGVYVLDDEIATSGKFNAYNCKFVLQKPSIEKMKDMNIVLGGGEDKEFVYTDSVFYFSHRVIKDLISFYDSMFQDIVTNKVEVDGYRDFLQPLGSQPLDLQSFLNSVKKDQLDNAEKLVLSKVYNLFLNRSTCILALTESKFFHLGTIGELFDSYLNQSSLESIELRNSLVFTPVKFANDLALTANVSTLGGVLMNTRIGSNCQLNKKFIIEYCLFDAELELDIGDFCYLSNCSVRLAELSGTNINVHHLRIPDNICMHTIPVRTRAETTSGITIKYVTIFFDRNDDLKKEYSSLRVLKFLNASDGFLDGLSLVELTNPSSRSIWNVKLFRAYETMSESFVKSLEFATRFNSTQDADRQTYFLEYFRKEERAEIELFSLFDILKVNFFEKMIDFRIDNLLV